MSAGPLLREFASYPGLLRELRRFRRTAAPKEVAFGEEKDQYFLHFAPEKRKYAPVIFYIHGGGWNSGSPQFFSFVGERLAREGWHCILLGYRKAPGHKWPAQMEDVCRGFRMGLQYLAAHNIHVPGALVVGSSAGAQLGALLCYSRTFQEEYGLDPERLLGFAGLGGPYLFSEEGPYTLRKLTESLFAPGQDRTGAQPCYCLEEGQQTPMLIIHSLRDAVVGYDCGEAFYRGARSAGIPATLHIVAPRRDSHSVYTAGCFLKEGEPIGTLQVLLRWLAERSGEPLDGCDVQREITQRRLLP